jgi:hypothetical protein
MVRRGPGIFGYLLGKVITPASRLEMDSGLPFAVLAKKRRLEHLLALARKEGIATIGNNGHRLQRLEDLVTQEFPGFTILKAREYAEALDRLLPREMRTVG